MSEKTLSTQRLLALLRQGEVAEDKAKFLGELRRFIEDRAEPEPVVPTAERIAALRKSYDSFVAVTRFQAGQLVQWKPTLKNRRRPAYDVPAIVIAHLAEPVYDELRDASTPFYREPLDLVLAWLDEDDEFLCYHFDSRRFQAYD